MVIASDAVVGDEALGEILTLVRAERPESMDGPPVPSDSNVPPFHHLPPDRSLRQFFDTTDTRGHGGTRFSSLGPRRRTNERWLVATLNVWKRISSNSIEGWPSTLTAPFQLERVDSRP